MAKSFFYFSENVSENLIWPHDFTLTWGPSVAVTLHQQFVFFLCVHNLVSASLFISLQQWLWLIKCTRYLEYVATLEQKAGVIVVLKHACSVCIKLRRFNTTDTLPALHQVWGIHSCSLLHCALLIPSVITLLWAVMWRHGFCFCRAGDDELKVAWQIFIKTAAEVTTQPVEWN